MGYLKILFEVLDRGEEEDEIFDDMFALLEDDLTFDLLEDDLGSESVDSENVFGRSAFSDVSAPAIDNTKLMSFMVI